MPNYGYNPQMSYQDQLGKYLLEQTNNKIQNNNISQPLTNMDFIIVGNKDEAERYVVQRGQTLWFRHSSKPEIYVKTVSNIGEPNFGAYRLEKLENEPYNASEGYSTNDMDNQKTNQEIQSLKEQVNQIQATINTYATMIDSFLKNDNSNNANTNTSTTKTTKKVGGK